MAPTINAGDHFYVSKIDYMFSDKKVPHRGDVIVFKSPKNDLVMVKRVIGLPNDKIKIHKGRLFLNGKIVQRESIDKFEYMNRMGSIVGVEKFNEYLPGRTQNYSIYEQTDEGPLDNTEEFNVPDGHIFLMGDNRDNSTDSRASMGPGYVPLDNLIGRADLMMFSFKRCKTEENLYCPPFRAMKKL